MAQAAVDEAHQRADSLQLEVDQQTVVIDDLQANDLTQHIPHPTHIRTYTRMALIWQTEIDSLMESNEELLNKLTQVKTRNQNAQRPP